MATIIIFVLVFASGFAGLVYEVLWLKELGFLFGSTTHAAATTLAVFFMGLAAGGLWWGGRSPRMKNPLRTYAVLEIGIAASASLYFVLLPAYHAVYSTLFGWFGGSRHLFLAAKFILATGILFLPSFFMGGTLPIIGQYLVKRRDDLGKSGTLLYFFNTLGAASGAFAAGFFLPRILGFRTSYLVAITMSVVIAGLAYLLSRKEQGAAVAETWQPAEADVSAASPSSERTWIWIIAFLSGFAVLALEVLWTRMFAQVLQNSVYSFAAILVVFLLSLAIGSAIAHALARLSVRPTVVLWCVLGMAGITVAATPHLFYHATGSMTYLTSESNWAGHMLKVFGKVATVMMVPAVLMAIVFPYLLKASERTSTGAGRTIGKLSAVNTGAAILGSVSAGFLLIGSFGLWTSILLMACVYLGLAVLIVAHNTLKGFVMRAAPLVALILATTVWSPASIPLVTLTTTQPQLYGMWEGSYGVVSVVGNGNNMIMRLDNKYPLGDLAGMKHERMQAHLPLRIHPGPRSVFLIGLGTGITAGAALSHPVDRVVICELIPEVTAAAKACFAPHVNGLFDDERVEIVNEDGRNYLKGTSERFDLIISDLFVPFNAGTGSLYSREHFTSARDRLTDNGQFVLWLPTFMLSRAEFSTIAKTMITVFPQVTLWRGNFLSGHHIVALVGQANPGILDPATVARRSKGGTGGIADDIFVEHQVMRFYMGNITAAKPVFADAPINTDDRPLIEYLAPITNARREASNKKAECLNGEAMTRFCEELFTVVPPETDPYLSELSENNIALVHAGLTLYERKRNLSEMRARN